MESRLGRRLAPGERSRIGVGQLRRFLEQLLQRRYLENVPTIVPVLEREFRSAARKLEDTQAELHDLHPERLKEKGRVFREAFIAKLGLLLRGTVTAPPERFGETLSDEHVRGGAFLCPLTGKAVNVEAHLPNAHMRLFGGAQYHRAMAEFRAGAWAGLRVDEFAGPGRRSTGRPCLASRSQFRAPAHRALDIHQPSSPTFPPPTPHPPPTEPPTNHLPPPPTQPPQAWAR